MSVEIDEQGAVTAHRRAVDYATAYRWAVDSPETITELVRDTKAFVTVIAAAEHAGPAEQSAAVREAFTAGVPREPGATWADRSDGPATTEPSTAKPVQDSTPEPAPGTTPDAAAGPSA